jgi:isocitrate dehydrogenase
VSFWLLEHLAETTGNKKAKVLAAGLDEATEKLLNNDKSPSRSIGGIDNRGSHFYLALYWAQALANQNKDGALKSIFSPLAEQLSKNEKKIVDEMLKVQGKPADIGGYYLPDPVKTSKVMRPSQTFNEVLASL